MQLILAPKCYCIKICKRVSHLNDKAEGNPDTKAETERKKTMKKVTCPLCMTKMKRQEGNWLCPECGYRYCDHNYDSHGHDNPGHDHYTANQSHSHNNYVTYTTVTTTKPKAAGSSTASMDYRRVGYEDSKASVNPKKAPSPIAKVIRIIVIVYVIYMLLSIFGALTLGIM